MLAAEEAAGVEDDGDGADVVQHGGEGAMSFAEAQVRPLITHRFPDQRAKQAFDLLYEHSDQAMGVLLVWE